MKTINILYRFEGNGPNFSNYGNYNRNNRKMYFCRVQYFKNIGVMSSIIWIYGSRNTHIVGLNLKDEDCPDEHTNFYE